MQFEKYENIIASSDKLEFQFTSEGPKGKIVKVIQFTQTQNENIYNLAFGNLGKDGSVDDETTNDNKDRNKILATVAASVYEFSSLYPDKFIFFCGTTTERTRLYRMALAINLEYLKKDFRIYGVLKGIGSFERVVFGKGLIILGLWLKEKKCNFTTMKKGKKIKGAEAVGVKVKVSKSLDKLSGKVLFPGKLKTANKIIGKLKVS
jgi:hypothetical protein